MKKMLAVLVLLAAAGTVPAVAGDHKEGREYIEKNGYKGPQTCEECHPGTAKGFLKVVHWKHASKAENVENTDPKAEYGMLNRIYTMCNGNDIVNNLKEIPDAAGRKQKFSGCNTCHPGDHLNDVGSTGASAEAAIDCLVCHSTAYDHSKRKAAKQSDGTVVMGQDRSVKAALAIGKPTVKNCMTCHEAAGGGVLVKRGFAFTTKHDVHAAKGMVCVDCHKVKDHRFPTGYDPNNWAHDGIRFSCDSGDCHGGKKDKPHKDEALNRHTAKIACQTCHVTAAGGAVAKDFTKWEKDSSGYFEPTTIRREAGELLPVYAWYNNRVANTPHFIGPKGSRKDGRLHPFRLFEGKGFFHKKTGELLSMDFAPPMSNGDTVAGVLAAAKTLGRKDVTKDVLVPGWQTMYFGANHLVAPKSKALTCERCHAPNGVLKWKELGYDDKEIRKLTSPEIYFEHLSKKQSEDW